MNTRLALVLLILLAVLPFSEALTLKAEAPSYNKGSAIQLSGTCDPSGKHTIIAGPPGMAVMEQQVNCFEGKFGTSIQTTFLDPSGNWDVTLSTENNSTAIIVQVEPVPESAYYRITFFGPAVSELERAETVLVSVEVTDSGAPVDGAEVVMHDVFGRRLELKEEGNGIYDLNYSLPYNSPLGEWALIVTASKQEQAGLFGGERRLTLGVKSATLDFEVIEPANKTYEQSDSVPIKIAVRYPNGALVSGERIQKAELHADSEAVQLESNSEGLLVLDWKPSSTGSRIVEVQVSDVSGNEGAAQLELVITCSLTCFLKNYGLIILVALIVIGVVTKLFYSRMKNSVELMSAKTEKKKTVDLIKNLQKEYFGKGVMPASSYKTNLASYKARIIELDEKIRQLEKRIEEDK